jgi:hypothetical protein
MKRFENRVAFVTGASRGIGAAIARRLASEGATVIAAARTADALERVVEEIRGAGGAASAAALDLSDSASIEAAARSAIAAHGEVHVLVNNAGVTEDNLILRMSRDAWDKGPRDEPDRRFPPDPGDRQVDGPEALRADRQRDVRRGADGERGAGELRRVEGGGSSG